MAKSKVLVTGGAGFIGRHLCEALLQKDYQVFCVDNLYTGSENNISKFLENPNFEFIQHDIIDHLDIKVNAIYNLACPASPVYYQSDPIKTIKTNVLGTLHLLELAKKLNVPILQASTSEVYGDPHVHPQKESYWGNVNPIGIRSCYDEGKRCAETLFSDYHRKYGVPIKIVRIFNTYGPYMNIKDGRVVSNFIVQALQNQDISIYGDGSQTRSFCYIDDLVKGMILMMENSLSFTGPVNLGNPTEDTITNLSKKILELTNSKSKLIYHPLPQDDPIKRKPDISLAKEKLNWQPQVSLQSGLLKTIHYFKNLLINYVH